MSLSTALSIAQNSLLNTQRQLSVVSRNVASAEDPNYARRSGSLVSTAPGSQILQIRRATNDALFRQNLSAISGYTAQQTIVAGLNRLTTSVNGVDNALSPATALGNFQNALGLYGSTPSNGTLAENAIESAKQLVRSLNDGSREIQSYRAETDAHIATAVKELNTLLSQFKQVNDEVVGGTRAGRDINDALDKRDSLLKQISDYIPISAISRSDNDVMIVTGDGTTLFETIPRHVSFMPTAGFDAATIGDGIRIDGVPIDAGMGGNTTASGSLAAMLQLRDTVATGMQLQLDEMARALIGAFAETDPDDPANVVAGLFTWPGAPGIPDDSTVATGLAALITVNALVDPSNGSGSPERLRDGINFTLNPGNNASFSDVIFSHIAAMDAPRGFMTASGGTPTMSLMDYSTDAIGWIEASRKDASNGAQNKSALMMRTMEALSNSTNVNVDEEMALLLELENSYAASARILQTIDKMLATLLDATR